MLPGVLQCKPGKPTTTTTAAAAAAATATATATTTTTTTRLIYALTLSTTTQQQKCSIHKQTRFTSDSLCKVLVETAEDEGITKRQAK